MTIGNDLLRFQRQQKYLIYDKETESLNKAFARPYQISFIIFTLDEILEEHDHYLFWKDLNVSKGAAIKTRFDKKKYLEKAEDPQKILDKFNTYRSIPNIKILGHNILGYDEMIYQVWRQELGMKRDYSYTKRCIDTGALAKAYQKNLKPNMEKFLAWQYRMLSMREGVKWSLSFMAKELKISYDENRLHEALYDIQLNIEVFKKLINVFEI